MSLAQHTHRFVKVIMSMSRANINDSRSAKSTTLYVLIIKNRKKLLYNNYLDLPQHSQEIDLDCVTPDFSIGMQRSSSQRSLSCFDSQYNNNTSLRVVCWTVSINLTSLFTEPLFPSIYSSSIIRYIYHKK